MQKEYVQMVETINKIIIEFNKILDPKFKIPDLDLNKVYDNSCFTCLKNTTWNDLKFPNSEKKGIYFLVGYDSQNIDKKVMYIGKASFNSKIGRRLYNHLTNDRNNSQYTMNAKGHIHILDYIFSIDLETTGLESISSSLEEYLILNSKDKINLLNGIGNN